MKNIQKSLSNLFSLLIPKENNELYTWGEITIGIIVLSFLGFAISLLPR